MKRWPLILVTILTLAYVSFFSWFTLGRHYKTNSTRFDLGNVEQVVWNGTQGRWFQSTDPYGVETVSRLAFHADYFLMALVPIYALAPTTETLLILQTLALASGIPAIWLIARRVLGREAWGVGLAALYAVQPSLEWMNIFDIHAVAFATPLILWAWWAAGVKRYWLMTVLVFLATLTKEQIGLSFFVLAAWLWWRQRQPRWALAMTLPAVWAILAFFILIPQAQSRSGVTAEVYPSPLGNSASEVIQTTFQHPRLLWETVVNRNNARYLFETLSPLGFLPLGNWLSLGGVPDTAINLMSGNEGQQTFSFHYGANILPWAMLGTIASIAWIRRRWPSQKGEFAIGVWVAVCGLASIYAYSPLPNMKHDHTKVVVWRNDYALRVRQWSDRLGSAEAISVTNNVGAHFARREHFYSFPYGTERSDYALVLSGFAQPIVASHSEVENKLNQLLSDPDWVVQEHYRDWWVLKRVQ